MTGVIGKRREWRCLLLGLHELTYQRRNLICFGIKREVSCVEYVDLRVRQVLAVAFRFAEIERESAAPKPKALAASSVAMPATLDRHRRSCGSHRRDRFESAPALARSEMPTHRSKDPGHRAQSSDRLRYGASSWLQATAGSCATLLHERAGPPRMGFVAGPSIVTQRNFKERTHVCTRIRNRRATAGREGKAASPEGKINLSPPGSNGPSTNPEQLFGAGYSPASAARLRWRQENVWSLLNENTPQGPAPTSLAFRARISFRAQRWPRTFGEVRSSE